LKRSLDFLKSGEELEGFLDGQLKHLGDVFAVEFNVERFAIEPRLRIADSGPGRC
jgi:hypothetical protein